MSVSRTFDAARLNKIANHPAVRPWLRGEGEIDLSAEISNPTNLTLIGPSGGFVLINCGSGDYDAHSIIARGSRTAVADMAAAVEYAFTRTDCIRITTKVADGNPNAFRLAAAGAFTELFRNDVLGLSCLELTLDRWVVSTADLQAEGEWFHQTIDAAGLDLPEHPADAIHDRAVGATVRMIRAGNLQKAVWFYNRWAAHAGYPGVRLISAQPVILDMGEAVVEVHGDTMEVLTCR